MKVRSFAGFSVMIDVPRWRPPRTACASCGRDTAVRRDVNGVYFMREHNDPETRRRCAVRWPVPSEKLYFPLAAQPEAGERS